MTILGIWDGHDSGAAVVRGDRILCAVNEERLTRRKLEVAFPEKSIRACLQDLGLEPTDIRHIGLSTTDFAKTLTRIFPSLKEEYYRIRRRKKDPGGFIRLKKKLKYKLTEFGPAAPFRWIGSSIVGGRLRRLGFENFKLHLFDHHLCHAAAAAFSSGFGECVVLTLDGVGDGLSGSVSVFQNGKIAAVSRISSRDSLGIFFEHVTNLLNMRELEDEGKVMALANYACPVDDEKNPMLAFFSVSGLKVKARHPSLKMYDELKKILWNTPFEQFAFMAQRTLEVKILELVRNAVKETGMKRIAFSGGVASNVKVNMLIRDMPEIDECFVFPHMGDGGLALGAAFLANQELTGVSAVPLDDLFLGPSYAEPEVLETLTKHGLPYRRCEQIERDVARLIAADKIVLWFRGRMEAGPRALGGRSILARADSLAVKNRLNLALKARAWFQPFCPSMLAEDARELLMEWKGKPDRFMTMGYRVKESIREKIRGVINIDGSCRPQIVSEGDHPRLAALLKEVKRITGSGVILNTSFNIHGDPVVCSPQDAVQTLIKTGADALAIEDYLVFNDSPNTEKRTP